MASQMIPPATAAGFLAEHGWMGAEILPLAGDASFRRYFRVRLGARSAVLMDAPPDKEDSRPFVAIARHLRAQAFEAPELIAVDLDRGLLLLEDFGDARVAPVLAHDARDEAAIYEAAVDLLVRLHRLPPPAGLAPYDAAAMQREVELFTDWYLPAVGIAVDTAGFVEVWQRAWADVARAVEQDPVLVLRDYHADNLMLIAGSGGRLGLLDFQDALAGHRAYDLVSLLHDARRDVAPALADAMHARYVRSAGIQDAAAFEAAFHVLGAQRNTKILGIFTRLWKRDGKPAYLAFQPRVWGLLERSLAHSALAEVRDWFDRHVPADMRAARWAQAQ